MRSDVNVLVEDNCLLMLLVSVSQIKIQEVHPVLGETVACAAVSLPRLCIIIIIMYIYYALINALSAHTIHINLNTIFYTHMHVCILSHIQVQSYPPLW